MLELVDIPEDRKPEDVFREFNHSLAVPAWRSPFQEEPPESDDPQDEGAPWWWDGAEDASQSFLRAQGITL